MFNVKRSRQTWTGLTFSLISGSTGAENKHVLTSSGEAHFFPAIAAHGSAGAGTPVLLAKVAPKHRNKDRNIIRRELVAVFFKFTQDSNPYVTVEVTLIGLDRATFS